MSFSIGKSDDELGRMLEVLRFWFTKDLVSMHELVCKDIGLRSDRNLSRGSPVNRTTRHLASSSGCVDETDALRERRLILTYTVQLGNTR